MAVGEPNIEQLQARIDSRQFAEWMAFYRLEPFGDTRDDLRMARLATVIANTFYGVMTGKEGPYKEADMLLQFTDDDDDADEADPAMVSQKWSAYLGGLAQAQSPLG